MPSAEPFQNSRQVNVAAEVPQTAVEGPGERYAVWVQGCTMRCPGCCNPHILEFRDADWQPADELARRILTTPAIEGVTFLGGEPFAQAAALSAVARQVRQGGMTVMVFTGYTREHLEKGRIPHAEELLAEVDLLVDGPYLESQASQSRRYIGSDNQRIHFLSEAYGELEDAWPPGNHGLELRLTSDGISINGHPRDELVQLAASLTFASPAEPVEKN